MSQTDEPPVSDEQFLGAVASLCAAEASLTQLGAGVLAALRFGLCSDSRSFARIIGVEHALVLREITALSGDAAMLAVTERNPRTHRTRYAFTPRGEELAFRVLPEPAGAGA